MQSINHPAQPASCPGLGRALRFQVQVEVVPSAARAPAAACQPGDGALVSVCPAEPGVSVTRAAGRHPSVNQRTGVTCDLHRGWGAGPSGSGQEDPASSSTSGPESWAPCRIRLALPGLLRRGQPREPGGERRCLPQRIHQLCKHKLFLTSLIS